jgi:hypothetical protein
MADTRRYRRYLRCAAVAGDQLEDFLKEIFSSLPFPTGTANIPKNVMKNDDFSRALMLFPVREVYLFRHTRWEL